MIDTTASPLNNPNRLAIEELGLVPVNNLLGESFFIPAYQRGFRWSDRQVRQLLDDLWDFKKAQHKNFDDSTPFYCLQPIVVKQRVVENELWWEVIDGQQRLTTIHILLTYFNDKEFKLPKRVFALKYETRPESGEFLAKPDDIVKAQRNIDFHHMHQAYAAIDAWFLKKELQNSAIRSEFYAVLVNDARLIWYNIQQQSESSGDVAAIEIFTRLNIGKILLTNSELIKAQLLRKKNFESRHQSLRQIQIAAEWDAMEKQLQEDSFWYFICDTRNVGNYENRLEYIFDMMAGRKPEHEYYHTFNYFLENYAQSNPAQTYNSDALWADVKQYFQVFEEWYKKKELYHLVGFLVDCGVPLTKLKSMAVNATKTEFWKALLHLAQKQVDDDIDELSYSNNNVKIRRVLLLMNIQTVLMTDAAAIRFPFDLYKKYKWDVEHIRSRTSDTVAPIKRYAWCAGVLEFLTGASMENNDDSEQQEKRLTVLKEAVSAMEESEEKQIGENVLALMRKDVMDEEEFAQMRARLSKQFKENVSEEDIDNIGNLTLLDSNTNRSYKNAIFPVKRHKIIQKDRQGVFIPLCTRNVFLKSHSHKVDDLFFWTANDARAYRELIKATLKACFSPLNNSTSDEHR